MLDTREVSSFADYFVICSGESERQIKAILEQIEVALKAEGIRPDHSEGTGDSGWVLLDYGDIVVHVFAPREREYYQLEKLWDKANVVVRIQ